MRLLPAAESDRFDAVAVLNGCAVLAASTIILIAFLAGCAREPAPPATQSPQDQSISTVDVVELSATDARDRMAAGTLTSRALTQAYLDRIAQIVDAGPTLNAV